MNIRFANDEELRNWDELIISNPDGGNVFQSHEMTYFKEKNGWNPRFLVLERGKNLYISVQEKRVSFFGNMWYLAKGPGVSEDSQLAEFLPEIKKIAKKENVFAVKIEPELQKNPEILHISNELGLKKVSPIQPNFSTILLDISGSEEEILNSMPRKGAKYSINRAKRDGVTVKKVVANNENCQIFYDLLAETARDSGFNIRDFAYHKDFWQMFEKAKIGQLFFAYFEGEIVAAAYAFIFGEKSTYKDGASVRERKAYGASHLLQWEVIRWAKENGSKVHDLCGTPPSDKIHDKNHPHYGIGTFKTSFSKEITDYIGAYDLPISDNKYKLWTNFGERLTQKIWRKTKNQNWY